MKIHKNLNRAFTLIEIMIVVAIIGLLAVIAIPSAVRARKNAQQEACINNLRQIDTAKQSWGLENKALETAVPSSVLLQPYMGRGTGALPSCPADSSNTFATSYNVNGLQSPPTCLIASNHFLN